MCRVSEGAKIKMDVIKREEAKRVGKGGRHFRRTGSGRRIYTRTAFDQNEVISFCDFSICAASSDIVQHVFVSQQSPTALAIV